MVVVAKHPNGVEHYESETIHATQAVKLDLADSQMEASIAGNKMLSKSGLKITNRFKIDHYIPEGNGLYARKVHPYQEWKNWMVLSWLSAA